MIDRVTYTIEEVARMLGISRGMAYEQARTGHIPAIRIGRRLIVPHERLHAWLASGTERSIESQEVA